MYYVIVYVFGVIQRTVFYYLYNLLLATVLGGGRLCSICCSCCSFERPSWARRFTSIKGSIGISTILDSTTYDHNIIHPSPVVTTPSLLLQQYRS